MEVGEETVALEEPPSPATMAAHVAKAGGSYACSLQEKKNSSMVVTGKSTPHQARSLRVPKPDRRGGAEPLVSSRGERPSISQTLLRVARQADAADLAWNTMQNFPTTRAYTAGGPPERSPLKRRRRAVQ